MKKTMQSVMEFINKYEKPIKFIGYSVYMITVLVMYRRFLDRMLPNMDDIDIDLLADEIKESSKSWDAPLE